MHINNLQWLTDLKGQYPKYFTKAKVLELGSGSTSIPVVRGFFKNCEYMGVDRVGLEGGNHGVDYTIEAKSTNFKKNYFDTLVCLSMFEHDPDWKKSLSHNLPWLKSGGIIIICFGAEGNLHHGPDPWKLVPYKEFLKHASILPFNVLDAFFEEERYGYDGTPGVFNILAKKLRRGQKKKWSVSAMDVRPVPPRRITFSMHISQSTKFLATISPLRFLSRILTRKHSSDHH